MSTDSRQESRVEWTPRGSPLMRFYTPRSHFLFYCSLHFQGSVEEVNSWMSHELNVCSWSSLQVYVLKDSGYLKTYSTLGSGYTEIGMVMVG